MDADLFGHRKDEVAIALIKEYEKDALEWDAERGYRLSFSGGKDSVVIKNLVKRAGVAHTSHYSCTTCDPPELVQFVKHHHPDVIFDRPKESLWALVKKKGVPTILNRWCCDHLKERAGDDRWVITGVRAEESARRAKRGAVEGCGKRNSMFVHPIINWSSNEVWQYIRERELPYCSLYDEGFKRLGCVVCPYIIGTDKLQMHMDRWPKLWRAMERAARYRWENTPKHHDKWPTFEHYWRWFMKENQKPLDDGKQMGMFT